MENKLPRPQAVIFDFGNVLHLPTDPEAFKANLEAQAAEHGFEKGGQLWGHIYTSEAWERAKRGRITRDEFWIDRLGALGVEGKAAVNAFRERLFEHAPGIHPGMRQLIYDLRPNARLAILSNTAVQNMARWLEEEHGMDGVFEVVISSADVGLAKPEPAIYHLTLERLELPPEAALFVDDLSRNTKAAEALGMPSCRFTTPEALRLELEARGLL
jgi:putative hydrolase of the HAD superfamily